MTKFAAAVVRVRARLSAQSQQRIATAADWRRLKGQILAERRRLESLGIRRDDQVFAELLAELGKASFASGEVTPTQAEAILWRFEGDKLIRLPSSRGKETIWNQSREVSYSMGSVLTVHRDFHAGRWAPKT